MGDIFNDRQVLVTRDEKYPGSHISDWVLMAINVTSIEKKDKEIVSESICNRCVVNNRDITIIGGKCEFNSIVALLELVP